MLRNNHNVIFAFCTCISAYNIQNMTICRELTRCEKIEAINRYKMCITLISIIWRFFRYTESPPTGKKFLVDIYDFTFAAAAGRARQIAFWFALNRKKLWALERWASCCSNSSSLSPRLGGVHTTNAAGRILNHKFMAPCARCSELSRGEVCVALLQRRTLFITRSPSLRSRSPLRSFPVFNRCPW